MKNISSKIIAAAIVSFVIVYGNLDAQPHSYRSISPEDQSEQFRRELDLSDAQAVKVKAIFLEQTSTVEKLLRSSEDERKATREALIKSRTEMEEKITAVLTNEQKERFLLIQLTNEEQPERQLAGNRFLRDCRCGIEADEGRGVPPRDIIQVLKNELQLTSEQEAKIQKILEPQQMEWKKSFEFEMKRPRMRGGKVEQDRNAEAEQMEKRRKDMDEKISSVLTPEQKKKFEEVQRKCFVMPPPMGRGEEESPCGELCPEMDEE